MTFSAYTVDVGDPLGDYLADKHLPNLVPRYSGDPRPRLHPAPHRHDHH
ncbi:hypothetical protein [Streptomyces sp. NRRL S-646]|nr:hypothetical protein [Streptomyces sp. NRRL S-646]